MWFRDRVAQKGKRIRADPDSVVVEYVEDFDMEENLC
jgi:hypothetical protein